MIKVTISLDDKDIEEFKVIIMDKDKEGALKFLKHKSSLRYSAGKKGNWAL